MRLNSFDVGSTSPEPDRHTKRNSPKATIGNSKRFKQAYKRYKDSKLVPHSYLSNLKAVLGSKSRRESEVKQQVLSNPCNIGPAISIPKSSRFSNFKITGPGPGDYNISTKSSYNNLYSIK